jgi:hypothetical protein
MNSTRNKLIPSDYKYYIVACKMKHLITNLVVSELFIALAPCCFIVFLNVLLGIYILIKRIDVKFICNRCKVQCFRICFHQLASQADHMSNTLQLLLAQFLYCNRVSYSLLCCHTILVHSDIISKQQCNYSYYLCTLQLRLASTGLVQLSFIFGP